MTIDQIPQSAKDDAYRYVREQAESDARNRENPYFALYEEQKKQNELLKSQLGVVRESRNAVATSATFKAPITMELARGQMGHSAWYMLTDSQKAQAVGWMEPVNRDELKSLFGRGADSHHVVDYQRSNGARYARLREVAKALNIYGG